MLRFSFRPSSRTAVHALAFVLLSTSPALAASIAEDYSTSNNPNGDWIYGRTNDLAASTVDPMTVRWASGWYLGNFGHGGPSVLDSSGTGPSLWAKDNSNGYPVIRWTAPSSGTFDIVGAFQGNDSRGVNNQIYVVLNGTTLFTDSITSPTDIAAFSFTDLILVAGDHLDFLLRNTGGNTEYGWTRVDATIVPESSIALLVALGLAGLASRRYRP